MYKPPAVVTGSPIASGSVVITSSTVVIGLLVATGLIVVGRSGHDTPWISKTACIEKYAPPWTVRRDLWMDSLRAEHSGISTDILLFSELGLSLTQH